MAVIDNGSSSPGGGGSEQRFRRSQPRRRRPRRSRLDRPDERRPELRRAVDVEVLSAWKRDPDERVPDDSAAWTLPCPPVTTAAATRGSTRWLGGPLRPRRGPGRGPRGRRRRGPCRPRGPASPRPPSMYSSVLSLRLDQRRHRIRVRVGHGTTIRTQHHFFFFLLVKITYC